MVHLSYDAMKIAYVFFNAAWFLLFLFALFGDMFLGHLPPTYLRAFIISSLFIFMMLVSVTFEPMANPNAKRTYLPDTPKRAWILGIAFTAYLLQIVVLLLFDAVALNGVMQICAALVLLSHLVLMFMPMTKKGSVVSERSGDPTV